MVSLQAVLVKGAPRMDLDTMRVTLVRDILLLFKIQRAADSFESRKRRNEGRKGNKYIAIYRKSDVPGRTRHGIMVS